MKTKMLLTAAWSLLTGVALHAAPLTVAVYDFKGDGAAASFGNDVTTLVIANLTTETNLALVERSELNKALNEQAFGISGLVSADAAAKIGQITGAKVLVSGQVIKTGTDHLIIVANVIGTETGRLFADKAEGAADNLSDLTSDLSRKIAQTISDQATNLMLPPQESQAERVDRILQHITGTNRPSILFNITAHNRRGHKWEDTGVANELGQILMQAGFPVVDANSDRKPDIEITGELTWDVAKQRGNLAVCTASLELKASDRRSGDILFLDNHAGTGTGMGIMAAIQAAKINVTDDLAARLLPLLAK